MFRRVPGNQFQVTYLPPSASVFCVLCVQRIRDAEQGNLCSCAGRELLSQPRKPSRWRHNVEHPLPPHLASHQQTSALDRRSIHSSAASSEVLHRSSLPCPLHDSSQAATVLGADLPVVEGPEERRNSRGTEPAWLGRANVARRERENAIPFSAKAFYVGECSPPSIWAAVQYFARNCLSSPH